MFRCRLYLTDRDMKRIPERIYNTLFYHIKKCIIGIMKVMIKFDSLQMKIKRCSKFVGHKILWIWIKQFNNEPIQRSHIVVTTH